MKDSLPKCMAEFDQVISTLDGFQAVNMSHLSLARLPARVSSDD